MAQYRQSGGGAACGGGGHHYANGTTSDHISIGVRASPSSSSQSQQQQYNNSKGIRGRRSVRSDKLHHNHRFSCFSIGGLIVVLSVVLVLTVLAYFYISSDRTLSLNHDHNHKDISDNDDDEGRNDADFLPNVTRNADTFRVLEFGQGSAHGRDSRYWDKDDRRRDGDYDEDDVDRRRVESKVDKEHDSVKVKTRKEKTSSSSSKEDHSGRKATGLYNEDGRKELKMYEEEYEASLRNAGQSRKESDVKTRELDDEQQNQTVDIDNDSEYDDGIDSHDLHVEDYGNSDHDNGDQIADVRNSNEVDGGEFSNSHDAQTKDKKIALVNQEVSENISDKSFNTRNLDNVDNNSQHGRSNGGQSTTKSKSDSKKKPKRRRGCEMKFLNSTTQLVEPFESRKFARFSLQYNEKEEKPNGEEQWEPKFAGHQSLQEREESFLVHDKEINCGFVKGPEGSSSTGFDLSEDDESYVSRCHIAVISCIFGNSDRLRSPPTKTVTRLSRKNVCFVMFMDELTLQTLSSEGHTPDTAGFIGFWKVVVVKNLPYTDMRRVGKIPKLLPHRLFPSARYSIWLDSKLRLQLDPLLVLEYFLWRKGYEYAISNHYDRHCVWEEVAQNKKLNKYNHTVIDQQFAFYQADGLKKFDSSDPNKLLPSNVPEGSLIVRAHTPMSNLFSCLWFNEVERFTPRDQLSFAYTYQKLRRMNPEKPFHLHMFKDCERRAVAKLFRHRSEEKRNSLRQQATE